MDLVAGEVVEEGEGEGAGGGFFGDGEVAGFGVEAFANKRLQMDRCEVVAAGDALFAEQV